jgi:hypothetical protein
VILYRIIHPLIKHRGKKSYEQKYASDLDDINRTMVFSLEINCSSLKFIIILFSLAIFGLSSDFFHELGAYEAMQQQGFYVVEGSSKFPKLIVLRIYGDHLIAAPLIDISGTIEKKLCLLKLSEMSQVPLIAEKFKSLKIQQSSPHSSPEVIHVRSPILP